MVISHKYKYLFVEFPLTGTTSISKDLVENYSGEKILFKHATYHDFLQIANEEEKKYFAFTCIRNPLDQAVSHYFKYKTDHRGIFSNLKLTFGPDIFVNFHQFRRFKYASKHSFNDYFLKFYRIPYNSWSVLSLPKMNYVIRFENLNDNYYQALKRIGIKDIQPLPKANVTKKSDSNYLSFYSEESISRAKKVFSIYMYKIGYDFPEEWGHVTISKFDKLIFAILNIFRNFYWRNIRRFFNVNKYVRKK